METHAPILVGVDYSTHSDAALAAGRRLALDLGAALLVAHVIPGVAGEPDPTNLWGSGEDAGQRERDRLTAQVGALPGDVLAIEVLALRGDAAEALLDTAEQRGCSLVLIGRRGTSAGTDVAIGAVAQRIVAAAPCPVVLCGPAATLTAAPAVANSRYDVAAVMRPAPITVRQSDTLAQADRLMRANHVHQLPVVEAGRLIGIISRHDVATQAGYLERSVVDAVMTQSPVTVTPETPLAAVVAMLIEEDINSLPVVTNGQLLGMVSKTDLLQQLRRMLES